jgi:dienelactone hydrolase
MNHLRTVVLAGMAYFLCAGNMMAQTKSAKEPTLKDLYGDFKPGQSQALNPLANLALILPDTKVEEWPAVRAKIHKRVINSLGQGPVELTPAVNKFEEIERYRNFDLTHIKYRYHVVDDIWNEGILVLPEKFQEDGKSAVIIAIHGTNGKSGKMGALGGPGGRRSYAIEMAKRGYIAFAPDLYGYGATINNTTEGELVASLLKKYPDWSYRGMKILTLIRAIDLLEQLPNVKKGAYGTMGNSLGGGMALHHAAIDNRVKVSVPSTGLGPAANNAYRLMKPGMFEEPRKWAKIAKDGKPPYDIHEEIALCAPRCMLFLDDFNDPYNADIMAGFKAVYQAMQVYQLLGTPGHISILVHGDGHDTVDDVREYAYRWFDRYLLSKAK